MTYRITIPSGEHLTAHSIEQFHALMTQLIARFGEDAEFIITAVMPDQVDSISRATDIKIERADDESAERTA